MSGRVPRLSLVSLGCAKNTVDSERALGALLGGGWTLCPEPADADLVLVNTCAFIGPAREESLEVLAAMLALKDRRGRPRVAAMGCFPQKDAAGLAARFPALDAVLGLDALADLPAVCRRLIGGEQLGCSGLRSADAAGARGEGPAPRLLLSGGAWAYLRIADGCDNRCAYCTIPAIRGPLRSRPADAIVAEARDLVGAGAGELALVAQDSTAYGADRGERGGLARLLRRLLAETEAPWIRVLYAHPAHLDEETIGLLASEPRLCRYLDLPLQHIHDPILRAMGRRVDRARIGSLLDRLLGAAPDFALRTSLITGFPGETEAAFAELLAWVKEGRVRHLGVFAYSPEPDTPAGKLGSPVPAALAEERRGALMAAQQELVFRRLEARVGQVEEVLIEREAEPGVWQGRTREEAPEVDGHIFLKGRNFAPGARLPACLLRRDGYDMQARVRSAAPRRG